MQKNRHRTHLKIIAVWTAVSLILSAMLPAGTSYAAAVPVPSLSKAQLQYAKIQADNAAQVVKLVNIERQKAGLKPLVVHTNLTKMAKTKVVDMYNHKYFSHTSPSYGSPFDMMDSFNITFEYAGENLARGQRTPAEVVKDWMNSPDHKANMLNPNYTLIGVGYYNGYWSQEFIGK
ncbi:CAP domain-containing protein [Paenibacillus pinistramenti]|uniref:CAP domain-containing protein n=1 Tax=Paenibacillus pinistramenti TaxID=1768003 RepID=UPI001108DB1D|nr:CAP domain-containing protein [Paenibacillus pinistramenti]